MTARPAVFWRWAFFMESLGSPFLLVACARHKSAVSSGHDRASFEDPELAALIAAHGRNFAPGPARGNTRAPRGQRVSDPRGTV